MQRGLRRGGAYAGSRAAKDVLQAANAKFHAGPDPLERESDLHVIQPSDRQQLEAMTKMLEETYKNNPTDQQKQALELWKFQVASGTVVDQVKFQFLRRFYFWLLGRGEQEDHEKTMWGRANTAVYNGEVAAYIDQFTSKRAQYAMKLQLLSMRIPDSLLGYYLYFKYIVNGALKRVEKNGKSFYDMSNDDYLQDFDVFQQVFDKKSDLFGGETNDKGASDIMGPMALRKPGEKAFEGVVPHPTTTEALAKNSEHNKGAGSYAISKTKMQENTVNNLDVTLGLNTSSKNLTREETAMGLGNQSQASAQSINGEQVASRTADVSGGGLEVNAPPVQLGTQGGALAATGGDVSKGKEELYPNNPAALEPLPALEPVDENGDPLPPMERVDTLPNAGSSIKAAAAADESETPKLTTPKTTREEKYAREFIKGMPDRSYDIESARKFLKEYAEKDATPVRGGVPRRGNRTMDSIVTPSEMHEETPMLNSATPKLVDDVVAAAGAVSDEQLSEVRKVLHQTVENEFQAIVQDTEEVVRLAEAERKRQAALNVVDARIAKLRTPHSKRLLK